ERVGECCGGARNRGGQHVSITVADASWAVGSERRLHYTSAAGHNGDMSVIGDRHDVTRAIGRGGACGIDRINSTVARSERSNGRHGMEDADSILIPAKYIQRIVAPVPGPIVHENPASLA